MPGSDTRDNAPSLRHALLKQSVVALIQGHAGRVPANCFCARRLLHMMTVHILVIDVTSDALSAGDPGFISISKLLRPGELIGIDVVPLFSVRLFRVSGFTESLF